jgi:hypothetical protein
MKSHQKLERELNDHFKSGNIITDGTVTGRVCGWVGREKYMVEDKDGKLQYILWNKAVSSPRGM